MATVRNLMAGNLRSLGAAMDGWLRSMQPPVARIRVFRRSPLRRRAGDG